MGPTTAEPHTQAEVEWNRDHAACEAGTSESVILVDSQFSPHAAEIFDAVECGVDVFDGCYPYTATERGCALTFPNQLTARDRGELGSRDDEAKQVELLPLEIDLKKEELVSSCSSTCRHCAIEGVEIYTSILY